MGSINTPMKSSRFLCCNKKYLINNDIYLDTKYNIPTDIQKIKIIQKIIRGFLVRNRLNPRKILEIQEISMEYNTNNQENNPLMLRLNNLLPKFELTEKETYYINNANLRVVALLYPNKTIYKGMINNKNLREGFGKLFFPDGSIYKGFFRNNKMEGRGRLLNKNGFVYEGEFKNGLSNGYGKYVALDGTTYKGLWLDNKQSGLGEIIYPDGSKYIGNFLHGKKNGQGKLTFRDRNVYEGNFENNEIKGEGSYHWKDGRFYVGCWSENKMNGYGIFIWPDKKKYYGHYVNNLKDGYGLFFWGEERSFEGFWKDDKQNGFGLIREGDDVKYGEWNDGKLNNIIDDENEYKKIIKMLDEEKKSQEFGEFNINIERYEKKITENSSGLETGRGNRLLQN